MYIHTYIHIYTRVQTHLWCAHACVDFCLLLCGGEVNFGVGHRMAPLKRHSRFISTSLTGTLLGVVPVRGQLWLVVSGVNFSLGVAETAFGGAGSSV